jgi:phosphatidylglycerophosphatase C
MQLVVFDLDGTITRHDTLVPYVCGFLNRHPWRWPRIVAVLPALARFALDRDRGALKSALIRSTLGGVFREQIAAWTACFVPSLLRRGVLSQALAQIAQHRDANDRLVLMSASVDCYVPQIGHALGFAETICTGLLWNGDRLDGRLTTANRRGEEKVRCLELLRQRHPGLPVVAYGNSGSDLPHLQHGDRGVLVNGSARARREAHALGVQCAQWS